MHDLPRYSMLAIATVALTMLSPLTAAEKKTSTQVSQANHLSTKDFGLLLSVPAFPERNVDPLCERHWSIVAKSDDIPKTKPDISLLQTSPTIIPVRDPNANNEFQNLMQSTAISSDVDAGTTELIKP